MKVLFLFSIFVISAVKAEDQYAYVNARLEVKAFINNHAHEYANLKVDYVGGDPTMVFVKSDGSEERTNVSEMSTEEIIDLIEGKGFTKNKEVPPPPELNDEL